MIDSIVRRIKWIVLDLIGVNEIPKTVDKSTIFPHRAGIFISPNVKLGKRCVIYQGVTLGSKSIYAKEYPTIGNNVIIYANSVVVGGVNVGDNVVIGANSVVVKDIPSNRVAVGNPARCIK